MLCAAPTGFKQYLLICESDYRGRLGLEERPYPQALYLQSLAKQVQTINASEIASRAKAAGKPVADLIHRERLNVITAFKKNYKPPVT